LIAKILESGKGIGSEHYQMEFFPGDDLFAVHRPRGLPIGNLTSQHWGNVYLNELDQYSKRILKSKAYIRYVDDILLFSNTTQQLHEWRKEIIQFLEQLRLKLHENRAYPRPVETGQTFLGFIVFPDHRRLKRQNGLAYRRRLKKLAEKVRLAQITGSDLRASWNGWSNHARYGNTAGLQRAILEYAGLGKEHLA